MSMTTRTMTMAQTTTTTTRALPPSASATRLHRLLANAVALLCVVYARHYSFYYGYLLWSLRRWSIAVDRYFTTNASLSYATPMSSRHAAPWWTMDRVVDYMVVGVTVVLAVNVVVALRHILWINSSASKSETITSTTATSSTAYTSGKPLSTREQPQLSQGAPRTSSSTAEGTPSTARPPLSPFANLPSSARRQVEASSSSSSSSPSGINGRLSSSPSGIAGRLSSSPSGIAGRLSSSPSGRPLPQQTPTLRRGWTSPVVHSRDARSVTPQGGTPSSAASSRRQSMVGGGGTVPVTPTTPHVAYDHSFGSAFVTPRLLESSAVDTPASRHHESPSALRSFLEAEREKEAVERMLKTPPHAVGGGVERRQTSPFLFESSDQQYAAAFGTTAIGAPRITFQPASKSPLAFTEAMKRGGGIGGSGPERGGSDLAGAAANVPFEEVCRRVMGVQDAELLVGSKRMRAWLRAKVVAPLVAEITDIDAKLVAEKMDHLTTRRATADTLSSTIAAPVTQPATFSSSMMTASQSSAPSTLSELQSRFSQVPLAQYRLRLEQHLAVPRATPADRSYIVDRLVALANDVDLGPYTWDGGDTGNSVVSAAASAYSSGASASMRMPSTFSATATSTRTFSVASTTPSDAEILFHVFCAFMDDRMRELGVYSGARPFTTQFVVGPVTLGSAATGTEKYRGTDDALRLHIVQRYPLKLALSHGRQQWEIYEGRNNLFYALLLFLRYYVRESAGYLDTLYLGGSLGLLEIARCGVE